MLANLRSALPAHQATQPTSDEPRSDVIPNSNHERSTSEPSEQRNSHVTSASNDHEGSRDMPLAMHRTEARATFVPPTADVEPPPSTSTKEYSNEVRSTAAQDSPPGCEEVSLLT